MICTRAPTLLPFNAPGLRSQQSNPNSIYSLSCTICIDDNHWHVEQQRSNYRRRRKPTVYEPCIMYCR